MVNVFKTPAEDLLNLLKLQEHMFFDPHDDEIPCTYTFHEYDFALWRQDVSIEGSPVEAITEDDPGKYFWSIGIGVKGYYSGKL